MNELFVRAVYYANNSIFVMGMVFFSFNFVFNPKVKRRWILLAFFAYVIVSSELFLSFGNMWVNMGMSIIGFVSFAFLFSGSLAARLTFSVLINAMCVVADGFSYFVLNFIFYAQRGTEMPPEFIQTVGKAIVNIVSLPFLLITILFFRKLFAGKTMQRYFKIPKIYTISVLSIISGVILIIALFASTAADDLQANAIHISVSFLIASVVILLIVWFYNALLNHLKMLEESRLRDHMLERWEIQYNAASDSQKFIADLNHNLRYNFLALSGYMKNGEYEKAEKHIENHIGKLSSHITTGNISIDAMLNYYQRRIREILDLELKTELLVPPGMRLDSTHVATVLGNAIENAMEACELVERHQRYIHLKASITNHNALLINITNPYSVVPVAGKDGSLITTKTDKRNHGMGLASIGEIMPQEKGQVYFEYDGNVFKFMAIFYSAVEED